MRCCKIFNQLINQLVNLVNIINESTDQSISKFSQYYYVLCIMQLFGCSEMKDLVPAIRELQLGVPTAQM